MSRVLSLALSLFFSAALSAATFTVNDLGDAPDAVPGNGACATAGAVCTLRAAIQEANALAGPDVVQFSVAGTISPATELPAIVQQLTIDGTTAPGYTTAPVVVIDGAFSLVTGLNFTAGAPNSILRGLQVYGFSSAGVSVSSSDVGIYNNYLGPVGGGTPNQDGLVLFGSRTLVGSNDGASGNVISGNLRFGVLAAGSGHVIADNYIGTDATGMAALPNGDDGVRLFSNANNVTVGGSVPGAQNVISGNGGDGIEIANASFNTVTGNYIGLNVTGTAAIPNGGAGVRIASGASIGNTVGSAATRTYISGNTLAGVWIQTGGGVVRNSTIGLATDGVTAIPNSVGVLIESGTSTGNVRDSVISGNSGDGISVPNATSAIIETSLIGTDDAGATAVPNGGHGIHLGPGAFVRIGSTAGAGNRIAGNTLDGIRGNGATQLLIYANVIGLAAGDTPLPNGGDGMHLINASNSIIGNAANGRNTVSANVNGIHIVGGTHIQIVGNRIGTDTLGTADRGNTQHGLWITNANTPRVTDNLISGNEAAGIRVDGTTVDLIANSNIIGLAAGLAAALPNATGIVVGGTASSNTFGTPTFPNVIAGNLGDGIAVIESAHSNYIESSIYNNGGLGIDLADDGVTLNDLLDADAGPNTLQNFPVITSATTSPTQTRITGTLNTTPGTSVLLTFYSSPVADPSGYGEGLTILGRTNVLTDPAGNAAFTFTGPPTTLGHVATATAMPGTGSSEFSQAVTIAASPEFAFSATMHATGEGVGTTSITVVRTGDTSGTQSVDYATSNNTATAGSDYTATSGTLTFNPGVAALDFTVPILDDASDEPNELVNLTLSNPTNGAALGTPSTATLEIGDNDGPPAITISDVTLAEGDAVPTLFGFTVSIPVASGFAITVDYATADGTATAGSDYIAATGTATIAAGSTSTTVNVVVEADLLFESDETFFVNLTNPANATIADPQGLGTITNDDPTPGILVSDFMLAEGDAGSTAFTFTVTLTAPAAAPITVDYTTVTGTATAGVDFLPASGTVTFLPGDMSETITVNVTGDTLAEPDETFTIALTNPTGGATISDAEGLGTILNDDGVPMILIGDLAQSEGNGGATLFTFTVTLSEPSASPITVDFATADGTATAGTDYTATSGTLTFIPGDTSETITVTVAGDTVSEPDETFFVNLGNATNATIGDAQATGTITNDDAALAEQQIPTLSEWSLIALGALLAALAMAKMR